MAHNSINDTFFGVLAMVGQGLYMLLGVVQLLAIVNGAMSLGLSLLFAAPIALFLAYIPLVGTVLGMVGAVSGWGWTWLQAGLLFGLPWIVFLSVFFMMEGAKKRTNPSSRQV